MSAYPSQEFRPLKKPKLGPPDVYPQDPKQKEDELTSASVKHGFINSQTFGDEYGSARRENINQEQFGKEFISVLDKKKDVNTFQDTSKKKQCPTKDNFWPAAKNKNAMEAWFKDLAGNKPLFQLGKKVPTFNKRDELFSTLCEFSLPMMKAAWMVKMTAAYNTAMQESKIKKRQMVDQSVDWCQSLTKFMRDQIQKIQDPYHGTPGGPTSGFLTVSTNTNIQVDLDLAIKQWHYSCKLARHMYDEGLLDRNEFLTWLIDLLEKLKQTEDTVLKLVMAQVLQYLDEITMSVLLSRRLAFFAAKKIAQLCGDSGGASPQTQSPMVNSTGTTIAAANGNMAMPQNPLAAVFSQYNNCPQHRGIILSLSATLQVITLLCPTSLIWNTLGDSKTASSVLCGSALDLLPCAPSSLPMPPGPENPQIRAQIRAVENQLKMRGRAAEVRWSSDKCQQSTRGFTISKRLEVLDMLDRHNFDKVDSNNSLDTLYNKVFSLHQTKEGVEPILADEPIIHLLIDWAVSTQRTGNYRAVVVAKLLEKRQNELRTEKFGDSDMIDDKDSLGSDAMVPSGLPAFQSLLMSFLDERAPVLDDNPSDDCRQGFANLIQLFCELIRHDVFSHDAYMCTLISRGDLSSPTTVPQIGVDSMDLSSIKSLTESIKHEHQDDIKVDMDINTMESDYVSLFDCVKDEHKPSPEEPASVKSVKSEKDQPIPSVGGHTHGGMETIQQPKGPSRHMIYAQHFPIPKDAVHECNQRGIVMYGVGKARDDARHYVKKISKETLKLFSKKNCVDTGSGDLGKVKKRKEKEPGDTSLAAVVTNFDQIFEVIFGKYQKLSYFDQHAVTAQCTDAVLEQINSFTMGNSSYLPLVDNISYLFDLMEYSLNIYGLLDFSVKLLKELGMVEHTLSSQKSSLAGNYTTFLCLCIVGVFRKYHPYLLVSQDLIIQAFEGLIGAVKDVYNPAVCTSAERCILVYLYNAYTSCSYLRDKKSEMFSNSFKKIKMTLYADINPSASNLLWDPSFMMDFMASVKSQPDTSLTKQLYDNPANRYSFVCNAMLNICNSQKVDRLNSISVLCAELTARCNSLSSEWLGVLQALCCSSNHSCGFIDVLTQVDVGDMSIHDSLAVFTAILIARHCFSLQDLVVHVVLPSLLAAKPSASGDQDAEPGARLTCHILLKLFKTSEGPLSWKNQPMYNRAPSNIKASCDRHLLAAAHDSITVGPVLAVLKAMLMLSDQTTDEVKSKSNASNKKEEKGGDIISTLLNSLDNDDDNMMFGTSQSKGGIESAGLSEFAKHALKEMCAQDWVQEKFLKNPESVLSSDLLLDPMLSNKQAQQLLQMICYPHGIPNQVEGSEPDNRQVIQRILQTLNQWGLRVSLLELQLMLKQATTQSDTNYILENVARGSIDLFHQQTESNRGMNDSDSLSQQANRSESDGVWMVGPLISKLQGVQGRVLKLAAQVLETGNNFLSKGKFDKERNLRSKSLLGHQPFLSLVLTCLKGQDEQREGLLCSLLNQLEKFINNCKEALDKTPDEFKVRQTIHEALQLRLSLVGGMFDTIQRNTTNTTDWGILLLQLVTNGIVDAQSNNELFTIILDMLTVLIYGTLITEGPEKEDNKRTYLNLIKKLRREIGDKNSDSMDKIRQLLPLPKRWYEVITCEPHGTQMDNKGNKYNGFGKKEGLQVSKKEKISPWEVIEGYKNPPPLSWSYFCAVKLERKPLKYEEQHRMMLFHTHSLRHPISHYLDPPVLPPEDLEPPPEKVEEKVKEPAEAHPEKQRKKPNKRRNPRTVNNNFPPNPVPRLNYPDNTGMYTTPHPSWSYNPPQPQQSSFYPQQQMPQGPRYSQQLNYGPKQALQTLIRGRTNPNTSNYPQNIQQMHIMNKQMLNRQVRQQLRQTFQNHQRGMPDSQGMFPNQMQPGGMQSMNQPQMGMQSNYGTSYGMQPQPSGNVMETGPPGAGMMSQQGYSQSYQGSQSSGMMPGMGNQPNYMAPQAPQTAPVGQSHFNTTSRLQHGMGNSSMQNPSSTMSGMTSGMAGYNQMASSGPSQHQQKTGNDKLKFFHQPTSSSSSSSEEPKASSYMQRMGPHQQQQQQQQLQMQQRRMMPMPNQQQMQPNQAALISQLQRQISVGPGQAPGPQYNNYPQPPQYQ